MQCLGFGFPVTAVLQSSKYAVLFLSMSFQRLYNDVSWVKMIFMKSISRVDAIPDIIDSERVEIFIMPVFNDTLEPLEQYTEVRVQTRATVM
jgi:hypothetical protein